MDCPFCTGERTLLAENLYAFAIEDSFPVSLGHSLVIPKTHVPTLFDLPNEAYVACFDLARVVRSLLVNKYKPDGFNIGTNCGESAGQTIAHAHLHRHSPIHWRCAEPSRWHSSCHSWQRLLLND